MMQAILEQRPGAVRELLYLVKAGDPVLRSRAVQALVDELLGGEDRTLVVEEFTVPSKTRAGGDERRRRRRPDDGARAPGRRRDRQRGARARRS